MPELEIDFVVCARNCRKLFADGYQIKWPAGGNVCLDVGINNGNALGLKPCLLQGPNGPCPQLFRLVGKAVCFPPSLEFRPLIEDAELQVKLMDC